MDRRLIFRRPRGKVEPSGDAGVNKGRGAENPRAARPTAFDPEALHTLAAKSPMGTTRRPVPQSDTGVPGEDPKAFGRTLVKELGKMAPYLRYKGRPPQGGPQRIGSSDCLSKTQDSANSQEDVWSLTPARCR